MAYYILTVAPLNNANNNFRFSLSTRDHDYIMDHFPYRDVFVKLPGVGVDIQAAFPTFQGYRQLVNPAISEWIINNGYPDYPPGSPYRLIFMLKDNVFRYYEYQANHQLMF